MLARTLWVIVAKLAQSVRIEIFLYIKTYLDRFGFGVYFLSKDGRVLVKIPLDRLQKAAKVMVTIEQKDATETEGEIAIEGEI